MEQIEADSQVLPAGCNIVELPAIGDKRGDLTFVEGLNHIPFQIARVYYLYDVPVGQLRARHAHVDLEQAMIAIHGEFRVTLDDGERRYRRILNRPNQALYVPQLVWREIDNFSNGAVCLVLASKRYDEGDYIRDYQDFLSAVRLAK